MCCKACQARQRSANAHYPFEQCLSDQRAKGYSDESAHKICGKIKAQNASRLAVCARPIAVGDDGSLPTEFCVFVAGANPNYNHDAKGLPQPQFTAQSLAQVTAAAALKGTDYFGDLEHYSLDPEVARTRADAKDAMCWYTLEARPDGSLWAVNVRWSDEGARRLRARLQRYVSPVFYFDGDTGEIVEFVNVAITSDPATYGIAPLVAASRAHATPRIVFTPTPAQKQRLAALARRVENGS